MLTGRVAISGQDKVAGSQVVKKRCKELRRAVNQIGPGGIFGVLPTRISVFSAREHQSEHGVPLASNQRASAGDNEARDVCKLTCAIHG